MWRRSSISMTSKQPPHSPSTFQRHTKQSLVGNEPILPCSSSACDYFMGAALFFFHPFKGSCPLCTWIESANHPSVPSTCRNRSWSVAAWGCGSKKKVECGCTWLLFPFPGTLGIDRPGTFSYGFQDNKAEGLPSPPKVSFAPFHSTAQNMHKYQWG